MQRPACKLLILSLLLVALLPAHAWHARGHGLTAVLAYEEMSPALRREVIEVLEQHPRFREDFASAMPAEIAADSGRELWLMQRAANWPDIVPHAGERARHPFHQGRWHYINLPVYTGAAAEAALDGNLGHNMSMQFTAPLERTQNGVQALQGNLGVWHDAAASAADRAVALCWILHLVGDLHQPTHTVALFDPEVFPRGDRGGNDVGVEEYDYDNLHAVWDALPERFEELEPSAATLDALAAEQPAPTSIAAWVTRHSNLAVEYVYTPELLRGLEESIAAGGKPAVTLSDDYLESATALAGQQVLLAGSRIAALLESPPPGGR